MHHNVYLHGPHLLLVVKHTAVWFQPDRALHPRVDVAMTDCETTISFNLELLCSETSQSMSTTLKFPEDAPPATVAKIKERIEEQFSIPVSVQSIKYEGHLLSENTNLEMMKIRPGDTFHVTYLSVGDCKEISRALQWFVLVKDGLVTEAPSKTNPMSIALENLITLGFVEEVIESLAYDYLYPWQDPRKYTNRLYIVQCGGLEVIMDIYDSLHKNTWVDSLLYQREIEDGILTILWNVAETFELRRLIISHNNGLDMCIKSLMRQTLEEGKPITDQADPDVSAVLISTIRNALGLLSK